MNKICRQMLKEKEDTPRTPQHRSHSAHTILNALVHLMTYAYPLLRIAIDEIISVMGD